MPSPRPGSVSPLRVPLAQDSALIDAGLDFALGPGMTLGASYSGQIASDLTDSAVKGRFSWLRQDGRKDCCCLTYDKM